MIGGQAVWADLLNKSQPLAGRPDLFLFQGRKHRQPSYNKTTGICEVVWCVPLHLVLHILDVFTTVLYTQFGHMRHSQHSVNKTTTMLEVVLYVGCVL